MISTISTIVVIIALTWVGLLALLVGMFRVATGTPTPQPSPLTSVSDDRLGTADATDLDRRLGALFATPAQAA